MKLFFTKAERIKYLGFDDLCVMLVGIFPLAGIGNVLFGGATPGISMWESANCYGISLTFTTLYWVVGRLATLNFRRRLPEQHQTAQRIVATLGVLAIIVVLMSALVEPVLKNVLPEQGIPDPPLSYKIVMAYTLVVMVLAMYEGIYFFTKFKESLLVQERLAKDNMQAQLSVLKQQMNPHFLFNSLNTLVNIIPEDAGKATLFTQRLSSVYRRILEWRHKELITLEEEVRALQDYVFLMQTRFEDKLSVCWTFGAGTPVQCEGEGQALILPAEFRNYRVVPLSVQLLVENAIKHNVVSHEFPLRIDIVLAGNRITVSNELQLRTSQQLNSTGWGHQNLKARYEMVTEDPIIITETDERFEVSIPVFPVKQVRRAATA
ncbi:sensor histidine kinase [Neolewinella persica]|uniref:sensor histidine kinase n=1 Tax=Neolewinella persica TaxID=70998 RepID=UPI0009FCFD52|nr:sensor histidine kinase [Neolewinella persica]